MASSMFRRACVSSSTPSYVGIVSKSSGVNTRRPKLSGSWGCSRPVRVCPSKLGSTISAKKGNSDDSHLVSFEEQDDGTFLFSFGTFEEAQAAATGDGQAEREQDKEANKKAPRDAPKAEKQKDQVVGDQLNDTSSNEMSKTATRRRNRSRRRAASKETGQSPPAQASQKQAKGTIKEEAPKGKGQHAAAVTPQDTELKGKAKNQTGSGAKSPAVAQKAAEAATGASSKSGAAPVTPPATGSVDLHAMKVPELRALAKERKLTRYSKMRKAELIELLSGPPPQ